MLKRRRNQPLSAVAYRSGSKHTPNTILSTKDSSKSEEDDSRYAPVHRIRVSGS